MNNNKKPHGFCETPHENCTMNYCDENGCINRKRNLVGEPIQMNNNMDERNDYNSIPEQQVLNKITRFEVIDQTGRIFVTHSVKDIKLLYQDEGRTLKVFLKLDNDTKRI